MKVSQPDVFLVIGLNFIERRFKYFSFSTQKLVVENRTK